MPLCPLPLIFISNNFLGILCSSILLTSLNHLSLLSLICFCISCIKSSYQMNVFLLLFLLVLPVNTRRDFVSTVCSLLSCVLVHVYDSASFNSIFLIYTLNSVTLHFLSIYLFHNKLSANF
jgi:hypothetical protein